MKNSHDQMDRKMPGVKTGQIPDADWKRAGGNVVSSRLPGDGKAKKSKGKSKKSSY